MEYSKSELMVLINNKMLSLEKEIKSRDRLEIIASIILIVVFGYYFIASSSLWIKIGSATIILAAIYISYTLKANQIKRINESESLDHSLGDHLRQELERVERQKKLSKTVAWWYIAPIVTGLFFITLGFKQDPLFKTIYMGFVLLIAVVVWKFNQKTVTNKFDPLITEIHEAIDFINDGKK
jgi:hypothetical protein